jgi:hypothetical protein
MRVYSIFHSGDVTSSGLGYFRNNNIQGTNPWKHHVTRASRLVAVQISISGNPGGTGDLLVLIPPFVSDLGVDRPPHTGVVVTSRSLCITSAFPFVLTKSSIDDGRGLTSTIFNAFEPPLSNYPDCVRVRVVSPLWSKTSTGENGGVWGRGGPVLIRRALPRSLWIGSESGDNCR